MDTTILSPKEQSELRQFCTGLQQIMGSAMRPEHLKCLENRVATTSTTLTLRFLTDDAALRWNQYHEAQIRMYGHVATAVLTTSVAILTGGTAGIAAGVVAGTAAGIAKDEVQARVWYPRVNRGWTIVRTSQFTYEQGLNSSWLTYATTDRISDHQGQLKDNHAYARTRLQVTSGEAMGIGASGIPEEMARYLIAQPQKTVVREFK